MAHKLLLADDSVTIQRVVQLTFADEDIQVITVGDGRQAIERVKSERPDIVLADVGMPERDGYEVAAFIKGDPQLSRIPVLLLTGALEPLDETRARAARCDGVLLKPFEPQVVISRVRELLAGHRLTPGMPQPRSQQAEPPAEGKPTPPPFDSASKKREDALDDYFDRLDAAFASAAGRARTAPTPPAAGQAAGPAPGPQEAASPPPLASAFAALLAAEEGRPAPPPPIAGPPAALPEDAVDEIVRRVIARMTVEPMRQLVLDAAERLVREEIERIKRTPKPAAPDEG
jgi:CheY-like chemotaxis protein